MVTTAFGSAMKPPSPIDPRVDIGHVHLKVADLDRALADLGKGDRPAPPPLLKVGPTQPATEQRQIRLCQRVKRKTWGSHRQLQRCPLLL